MVKIERITVICDNKTENSRIRLDWDNDRHQIIRIERLTPSGVIDAFEETIKLISKELSAGNI